MELAYFTRNTQLFAHFSVDLNKLFLHPGIIFAKYFTRNIQLFAHFSVNKLFLHPGIIFVYFGDGKVFRVYCIKIWVISSKLNCVIFTYLLCNSYIIQSLHFSFSSWLHILLASRELGQGWKTSKNVHKRVQPYPHVSWIYTQIQQSKFSKTIKGTRRIGVKIQTTSRH